VQSIDYQGEKLSLSNQKSEVEKEDIVLTTASGEKVACGLINGRCWGYAGEA